MQTWRDGRRNKERAVKGRCVIGSFAKVMKGRNVPIDQPRLTTKMFCVQTSGG